MRAHVANELGISEGVVIIMTAFEREWYDICLDLPTPELCAPGPTFGYEITVQAQGKELTYRTNEDGSILRQKF